MSFPAHHPLTTDLPAGTGLPRRAGIGFKSMHFDDLQQDRNPPAFIEVHAENYMGAGGLPHAQLTAIRESMPISLHGVGLSIGATAPLDLAHLGRLEALVNRYQPAAFSEHLAWSSHDGTFFNDLLPLSYDAATLQRVCEHIDQVQERLRRRLLLENPSTYFEFDSSTFAEPDFIAAVVRRTGCGLLLDVNNVHVTCHNNGHDPLDYLSALPLSAVAQIHLAGHARERFDDGSSLLIDNHGSPVSDAVWQLYAHLMASTGPLPTLIEWDTDVPAYVTLRAQARMADEMAIRADVAAREQAA